MLNPSGVESAKHSPRGSSDRGEGFSGLIDTRFPAGYSVKVLLWMSGLLQQRKLLLILLAYKEIQKGIFNELRYLKVVKLKYKL